MILSQSAVMHESLPCDKLRLSILWLASRFEKSEIRGGGIHAFVPDQFLDQFCMKSLQG